MATKPSEPNKFITLKKSIAGIHKDISFLKKCITHKLTPTSHKIVLKTPIRSDLIRRMESQWIKESIKKLYGKLNTRTLECYSLHLKLARDFPVEFPNFLVKVKIAEYCESERKRKLHDKKFRLLRLRNTFVKKPVPTVQKIDDFVVNRSSQTFTDEQLTLLNKGLKFAINVKPNIENVIIDIDTALCHNNLSNAQVTQGRVATAEVIREHLNNVENSDEKSDSEIRVVSELKKLPVFFLKADKGNNVVILDKEDYNNQLSEKLENGPYRKQRTDPLPEMVKLVEKTLKDSKKILGDVVNKLRVSCPSLPRIKGLPKIHKPGNEMREIISAIDSPTHKISKWLVEEFQSMPIPFPSRSVTSTLHFTQQLQTITNISEDEIMVSFDVKALFPSVPVKEAINLLEDWLLTQHENTIQWKVKVRTYLNLTKLCMEQNYFTFRGNFYKQTKGAPMGNSLSPFLSELFMANLEYGLQTQNLLPKLWWRYVDDVFCIINRNSLPTVLETINKAHKNIQFTYEVEVDGKLPFLDILIIREPPFSSFPQLTFEIYRKPTNTRRTIPYSSNHSQQHKMAAYQHMIHRMQTLPLSDSGKEKELQYIFETADLNGYQSSTIQAIFEKKTRTLYRKSLTTLTPINDTLKRVAVDFDYNLTRRLRPKLEKFGLNLVFSSRRNQLHSILGSTKDPLPELGRSGVYKISCSHCDKVYVGQTKRTLDTRFKEHLAEVTKAKKELDKDKHYHFKSKVAEHIYLEEHLISTDDITVARRVTSPWKLDVAESLEIYKQKPSTLLNRDQGNGYTWLFKLLPTRMHHTPSNTHPDLHELPRSHDTTDDHNTRTTT